MEIDLKRRCKTRFSGPDKPGLRIVRLAREITNLKSLSGYPINFFLQTQFFSLYLKVFYIKSLENVYIEKRSFSCKGLTSMT